MRNVHVIALIVGASFAIAAPAMATSGSVGPSRPVGIHASVAATRSFSLRAAHAAALATQRSFGLGRFVRIARCRWVTPHKAACPVVFGPAAIVDGAAPVTFIWTDYVIRPLWNPRQLYAWGTGLAQT